MALVDWTLKNLGEHMARIARKLHDPVLAGELLSEARQDTPIVADILHHIAVAAASGPHRGKSGDLAIMRRDLLLFLALRELEREEVMIARARRAGTN
jgi:hypothetical protein